MRPGGEGNDEQYRGSGQPGWQSGPPQGPPPYGNSQFGGPAGSPPFGPSSFGGRPDPYGPSDPGTAGERGQSFYGAPPAAAPARGRPGLILLTAFLVELVVVAAVGNTWAVRKVLNYRSHHNDLSGAFVSTPGVFAWRFTPQDHDTVRQYPAQLLGLLTLFVLAALLTLAVVRGAVTFGRAFFGIWMAVIVAVLADGIVQRAVEKDFGRYAGLGGKSVGVFFGGNGYETMAGIGLGFVTGLVAALVAIVTRRPAVVAAPPFAAAEPDYGPDPDAPPPFFGEPSGSARASDATRSLSMQKVQDAVGDRRDAPPPPAGYRPAEPAPSSGFPSQQRPSAEGTRAPEGTRETEANRAPEASREGEASREREPNRAPEASREDEATQAIPVQGGPSDRGGDAPTSAQDNEATVRRSDLAASPGGASAPAEPEPGSSAESQPTTAFPRPPDDEDLGHHPE